MTISRTELRLQQAATNCSSDPARAILGLLHAPILRILAEGRPATVEELAAVTSRPMAQIQAMLRRIDPIEMDADGSVLGLGLSLVPTAHAVKLSGRQKLLYAWCAPDALILPSLIGESARVTSPCHATKQPITVELSGDGVTRVDPPTAVVSFVLSPDRADLRGTGCDHQNLFASADAAATWISEHPYAEALSVTEAFALLTDTSAACRSDI